MTTESIFNSPFFSPEFRKWLMTADLEDIYSFVSDHYKERYGIRPRHLYNCTREEYAQYFIIEHEFDIAQKEHEELEAVEEPEPYPYEEYGVT